MNRFFCFVLLLFLFSAKGSNDAFKSVSLIHCDVFKQRSRLLILLCLSRRLVSQKKVRYRPSILFAEREGAVVVGLRISSVVDGESDGVRGRKHVEQHAHLHVSDRRR